MTSPETAQQESSELDAALRGPHEVQLDCLQGPRVLPCGGAVELKLGKGDFFFF